MQNNLKFDINKKTNIEKTFRVAKVMADFDLKLEHSNEHFQGNIEMPENWHIGAIVGASRHWKKHYSKRIVQR